MPADVTHALCNVLAKHGPMSAEEAKATVENLEASGRFQMETWA
jgi:sulfite reductase alpha subunit-like flavoprotein